MRIGGVDFPEALLAARKNANLVVFAGAGASMPPPSNYPNFEDLANRVASGRLTLGKDEPIDHFLGKLHDLQVKVHRLVRDILTNPESKPNSVHFDLLRLFESADTVRLVTTNFDMHFSAAASQVFSDPPEIHYAPGLPLGHSFSGIVYLHGGVNKPPERLVLTDSDFGRAYLTEGWARLFLQRVFETYVVLFVGYSHNDPVMNYLARGFTPEMGKSRRFALIPTGDEETWIYRGIAPITYQLTPGDNPHSVVPMALSSWAEQARLGTLEKEQRIREIVALPPPIDPEIGDFIESTLSEISTARFFTRHAHSVDWMKWVEQKKLCQRLFDPTAQLTQVDMELGLWIAKNFQCEYSGETLSVLRRQGQRLHPFLWTVMAQKLSRDWATEKNRGALRRWLAVLISLRPGGTRCDFLEYIGARLTFPDDVDAAVLIFEYLTRPILRLDNNLWSALQETGPKEDVYFELESHGGGFWLNHFWENFFEPNLDSLSDKLEPIISSQLQMAYFLSHADKGIEGSWDTLSLSRNLIEQEHGGQHQGNCLGVLIDVAFAVVKWNARNRPPRLDSLIELWFTADSVLLKRLAILAVALNHHWESDHKLQWLLDNDLLYTIGLNHEVFEVLKDAYPRSSEGLRQALLDRAERGRFPVPEGSENAVEYEKYNLVYWIHQSDPRCSIAQKAFADLQQAHSSFKTREHPDSAVEFGPVQMGLQSPLNSKELVSKSPQDHIDFLLSYEPQRPFGPSREGMLEDVETAAASNYSWSWQLAEELKNREAWKTDLWSALVRAWTHSDLHDDEWNQILIFLDHTTELHPRLAGEITNLLEDGIKKASRPIPNSCFGLIEDLSKKLWLVVRAQPNAASVTPKECDWVARAINHPGGRLTLFWISWLARQRKESAGNWKGIPTDAQQILETVLKDDTYAAELGRVLLASQLNFFFSADEAWTRNRILPLFDWAADSKRALLAFHGFLTWGRQTEALLPYLLPMYEKAFPHVAEFGRIRDRFIEYLAGLAVTSSVNPLTDGWLNRFLATCQDQDRLRWTANVGQFLRGSNDAGRLTAWQTWIKRYWAQRLSGIPAPLGPIELGEMVEWSMHLGPSFPEVADAISNGPQFELRNSFIFRELSESVFPAQYPEPTANLLLKTLGTIDEAPYDLDKVEEMVRRIAPLGVPPAILKAICEQLGRLGYPPAAELEVQIRPK